MSVYSDPQIDLYLAHIGLPFNAENAKKEVQENPLGFLTSLQRHHMARVPFDSLALHYSPHRSLSLHPEALFGKIVRAGRGGYCMEVNQFMCVVLRSLGFQVYSVGGRVGIGGVWGGWNHQISLVTIADKKYIVDVGFGTNGPSQPTPLEDGLELTQIAPATGKLEYKSLPFHTDPSQRMWVYSIKPVPPAPWLPMYAFTEVEFFSKDFEVMNLTTMTSPRSFFVQNVMCMRIILDEETKEPVGLLVMHRDYVKKRVGEKEEMLEKLETEPQRVEALKKYFDIALSPEEQASILGLASELRQGGSHA